ncbi:hypothetical protein [Sporosalibacterium faouarense]|uniref:hypothetical protein n=1 Tax=Sporosalibacterium faouarense TaxID=516123 RepID=UPI00192AA204|nr:hypothetical protein [Sporosalibacterium faouarense]
MKDKDINTYFKELIKEYDAINKVKIYQSDITLRVNYYSDENFNRETRDELFEKTKEYLAQESIQNKIKLNLKNTHYYRAFEKEFNESVLIYFEDTKSKKIYHYSTDDFGKTNWEFSYFVHDGESYEFEEEYVIEKERKN